MRAQLLIVLRLSIFTMAGVFCAAGVSYVCMDLRWNKAERELAEFRVKADEDAQKAAIRPPIPEESSDGRRYFIVPIQGSPEITDADREQLDALGLKCRLLSHHRDLAALASTRSALVLFVLTLIYGLLIKTGPNQALLPTPTSVTPPAAQEPQP